MKIQAKSWALVGIAALLVGGCSGTVDGGGSGGTGSNGTGATGGNGAGGHGTAGMGTGGHGTGGMGTGGIGTGGQGTGGQGTGGGSGIACGGFAGVVCPITEYCDFPDDICGGADGQGVCRARPEACPEFYAPVCACDGMVYSNDCFAAGAGTDVSNFGGCPPPTKGLFNCGHIFCDAATQYCRKTFADVPGGGDSFTCTSLPAACSGQMPSCGCIGDPCGLPIPGKCAPQGDGFIVTCGGG